MPTTPKVLDLTNHYQTADDIAEGKWFTLDSGLEVLVARTNSPEFYRAAASMFKKHGGKRGKELSPDKTMHASIGTMARAIFKAFRGPNGEKEVQVGDETIADTVEGRERLLSLLPDLREEVSALADLDASEFAEWVDEAGKA
jgi:hypothetical protein